MVNEAISREYQTELPVDVIIDMMVGREVVLPQAITKLIEEVISQWCDILLRTLHQNKIDYRLTQTFFAGGGATLLSKYAKSINPDTACITYIADVKANAIGYELLAAAQQKKMGN